LQTPAHNSVIVNNKYLHLIDTAKDS
jgi:hypothetical protein